MASTTEERIGHLLNNAILPTDDHSGCFVLFDEYFFKNNEFLESKRGHAEEHRFNTNNKDSEKKCDIEWKNQVT